MTCILLGVGWLDFYALAQADLAMQVLESSSDGTLTHPALLKDRVASPAGTTIAGMQLQCDPPGVSCAKTPLPHTWGLDTDPCEPESCASADSHPSEGSERCSPGAGLTELESAGMRGIIMRAVRAAAKRSEDMG